MKKEYYDVGEYTLDLAKQIRNDIKENFVGMYDFGKLAFGKNLMKNMNEIRKNRIENKLKFCWEK